MHQHTIFLLFQGLDAVGRDIAGLCDVPKEIGVIQQKVVDANTTLNKLRAEIMQLNKQAAEIRLLKSGSAAPRQGISSQVYV